MGFSYKSPSDDSLWVSHDEAVRNIRRLSERGYFGTVFDLRKEGWDNEMAERYVSSMVDYVKCLPIFNREKWNYVLKGL